MENIKDEFLDPRLISKRHDQVGRDTLTGRLRDIRRNRDELQVQINEHESSAIERRKKLIFILKEKFRIPDLVMQGIGGELDQLRASYEGLPSAKNILAAYYESQMRTPLTQEEKREFLTADVLGSLSEEEYVLLWKRLNPYFLAHVTRQGFRDHNAMFYHSAGMREFHGGFVASLEDGKMLRPPFAIDGLRGRDKESVRSWLSQWVLQAESETEARERLFNLLNYSLGSAPSYPDKTAVHFAAELVADGYYGGERGNEVFYVYPTDCLASQHNFSFNGWEKDFTKPQSETKWNDVFVWPDNLGDSGIPLDSGIVFLPESTQVDPETGSASGLLSRKMVLRGGV